MVLAQCSRRGCAQGKGDKAQGILWEAPESGAAFVKYLGLCPGDKSGYNGL